jgi:hypothetical protein
LDHVSVQGQIDQGEARFRALVVVTVIVVAALFAGKAELHLPTMMPLALVFPSA